MQPEQTFGSVIRTFVKEFGRNFLAAGRHARRSRMMRLVALAGFAVAVATSAQAMPRATLGQADGLVIQVRQGCGIGMVLLNGQCVSRHDLRVERRMERRAYYGANYGTAYGNTYGTGIFGTGILGSTNGTGTYTRNNCYPNWDQDDRQYKSCAAGTVTGAFAYVDTPGALAIEHYRTNWGTGGWYDYASRNGIVCAPGTNVTMGGQVYLCQ
jgi:hypothetical protein